MVYKGNMVVVSCAHLSFFFCHFSLHMFGEVLKGNDSVERNSAEMGRAPCCLKVGLHRGPWTAREDILLTKYIQAHGEGNWRSMPMKAGLLRCGKSCRLRWINYLRPDIKRGNISPDEEDLIIRLHSLLGNRWSLIAGRLPGRTDNEIKNYWNTHLSKRLESQGRLKNRSTSHKAKTISMIKNKNKNKNKKRQKSTEGMDTHEIPNANNNKNKVHLPKAIRLIISKPISEESLNNVVEENKDGGGGSGGAGTKVGLLDLPWSSDDGSFLVDSHDIINGCDLACPTNQITKIPTTTSTITYEDDHMLEKVYGEYWELLNKDETCNSESQSVPLDSFVESLWV